MNALVAPSVAIRPGPAHAEMANAIRFLAIDAIVRAGEGHQGVPLGMAEIATALFTRHLKFDASDYLVIVLFVVFVIIATYLNVTGRTDHYLLPFLV